MKIKKGEKVRENMKHEKSCKDFIYILSLISLLFLQNGENLTNTINLFLQTWFWNVKPFHTLPQTVTQIQYSSVEQTLPGTTEESMSDIGRGVPTCVYDDGPGFNVDWSSGFFRSQNFGENLSGEDACSFTHLEETEQTLINTPTTGCTVLSNSLL